MATVAVVLLGKTGRLADLTRGEVNETVAFSRYDCFWVRHHVFSFSHVFLLWMGWNHFDFCMILSCDCNIRCLYFTMKTQHLLVRANIKNYPIFLSVFFPSKRRYLVNVLCLVPLVCLALDVWVWLLRDFQKRKWFPGRELFGSWNVVAKRAGTQGRLDNFRTGREIHVTIALKQNINLGQYIPWMYINEDCF